MVVSHNANEIYSVINALSDMFRYITRKKGDFVHLEEEMEHIKNYLYIQNLRFEEKVEINVFMEEDLNKYYIPILTIQPIVENVFIHGLENKKGVWLVSIEVQKVFDDIEVTVEDNGVGISKERLKEITEQFQSDLKDPLNIKGSVGMKNVSARMKLSFGSEYGLDISSKVDEGTKIVIRFPATLHLKE